jgi:hypothetical protein
MEKTQNRISSPEATGGAGPTFEQKVGVYWLVQLLVGCIPPIFVDSVVERVAFQTEHLGWNTDDLLITCANGAGHTKQLAAQVKRTFTVSASDEECEKAILDFGLCAFSPRRRRFRAQADDAGLHKHKIGRLCR